MPPSKTSYVCLADLSGRLKADLLFHRGCCGPCHRPRSMSEVWVRLAYARTTGEPFARAPVRPELP
ncbi:hypothetical protein GCM10018966_102680 [Streptomyces yanii]